jgi:hypothetical protein
MTVEKLTQHATDERALRAMEELAPTKSFRLTPAVNKSKSLRNR